MLQALGIAALLFGLFFCAVGVIGVIRLPDVLTRLHASGKVAILGLFGLLLGAALLMPQAALRLLTLGLFMLLTSPVATHAIAAAVYRRDEIAHELAHELEPDDAPKIEEPFSGANVTAVLTRSRIQDIIEAQERALQQRSRDGGAHGDSK